MPSRSAAHPRNGRGEQGLLGLGHATVPSREWQLHSHRAITRYWSASRGVKSRYWNEEVGKPCSKRTTGTSGGPASVSFDAMNRGMWHACVLKALIEPGKAGVACDATIATVGPAPAVLAP